MSTNQRQDRHPVRRYKRDTTLIRRHPRSRAHANPEHISPRRARPPASKPIQVASPLCLALPVRCPAQPAHLLLNQASRNALLRILGTTSDWMAPQSRLHAHQGNTSRIRGQQAVIRSPRGRRLVPMEAQLHPAQQESTNQGASHLASRLQLGISSASPALPSRLSVRLASSNPMRGRPGAWQQAKGASYPLPAPVVRLLAPRANSSLLRAKPIARMQCQGTTFLRRELFPRLPAAWELTNLIPEVTDASMHLRGTSSGSPDHHLRHPASQALSSPKAEGLGAKMQNLATSLRRPDQSSRQSAHRGMIRRTEAKPSATRLRGPYG